MPGSRLTLSGFRPILAGATARDRAAACIGALFVISLTGLVSRWLLGGSSPLPALMFASIGASAVLVFAVPASPLAQPWPVIGGNVISATVGLGVVHLVPDPMIAAGVAVAAAIAAMTVARCLHPPGGGTAIIPVLAGVGSNAVDRTFPIAPVALNAVLLVVGAWLFHRMSGHSYPHRTQALSSGTLVIEDGDIAQALADLHEPLDVSPADLKAIATAAANAAITRQRAKGAK